MIKHSDIPASALRGKIKRREIVFAGNRKLKIYGHLSCASGKRMKPVNRVFFATEAAAIAHGFRPCAHCMYTAYKRWNYLNRNQTLS
jgi:methylphosphotriester-DNA--protein-cysteine methyltransferase